MTPKSLLAAAIAATLAASAAQADMFIVQQGPTGSFSGYVPSLPSGAPGSGFDMATGFIADMAATRMPGFHHDLLVPAAPAGLVPDADTAYDEISFAGDWQMVEAPGMTVEDLVISDLPNATFSIDAMGEFTGYAGCNRIFGTLNQQGGALVEPMVAMTQMACPGLVGNQERALTQALQDAAMFAHAGDILVLLDAEGDKLAEFRAM